MATTAGRPTGAHDLQGLTILDPSKSTRGREGLSAPGSPRPTTSAPSSSLTQPQPRHLKKGRDLRALCHHMPPGFSTRLMPSLAGKKGGKKEIIPYIIHSFARFSSPPGCLRMKELNAVPVFKITPPKKETDKSPHFPRITHVQKENLSALLECLFLAR